MKTQNDKMLLKNSSKHLVTSVGIGGCIQNGIKKVEVRLLNRVDAATMHT